MTEKAAHVVIDRDTSAKINLGILISIIVVSVLGATYLQNIEYEVSDASSTLRELKVEFARQNDALMNNTRTLIRHDAKLEEFDHRLSTVEGQ